MQISKIRIRFERSDKEWLVRAAVKIFKNEFRQFVWVLTESRDEQLLRKQIKDFFE